MGNEMENNDLDLARDVRLSKDTLDTAAEMQADLYWQYSKEFSFADEVVRSAKNRVKFVRAEEELNIRQNKASYAASGIKLTEASVASLVETNSDVQAAERAYIEATRKLNEWKGALLALQQKKSMIETLTKQWAGDYFAKPNLSPPESDGLV